MLQLGQEVTKDLGRLVNEHRRRKHLTQQQLAERVHLHRDTISHLEHGTVVTGFADVVAILRALDLDVEIVPRPPDRYP